MQIASTSTWQSYKQTFTGQNGSTNAGSASNPYIIDTPGKLAQIVYNVTMSSYAGKYFKQTADINLGGHEWVPIGTESHPFEGNYDGQNHIISGMNVNKPDSEWLGLFGFAGGNAYIQNINIRNSVVVGKSYVGSVLGCKNSDDVHVKNCSSDALVKGSVECVGGISGICGVLENNVFYGSVVAPDAQFVGGISGEGVFTDGCINEGIVIGNNYVGGILGKCWHNIDNCMHDGAIYADGESAALIVGLLLNDNNELTVTNCHAEGTLFTNGASAGLFVGGFSGSGNMKQITNCSAIAYKMDSTPTYYGSNFSGDQTAISIQGCFYKSNSVSHYSGGSFSGYSIVENMNGGLPMQNALYSIAVGGFTSSQITSKLQSLGYTYSAS